jgi:CubicO group peptidase (beta-lactamase class C family)
VGAEPSQAAHIVALARDAMARYDLKAVIVRVTIDGREVVTTALGESMTGVPATTDMHFHNGSVVFSYMSMLLLVWVDQGVVSLDDPLSNWLPELPDAERVTLRMLTNMTAGYQDYVANQQLIEAFYANPFRQWTPQELIAIGLAAPRVFEPGTNWAYSHTNLVILGQALEKIGGKPLASLLQEFVLAPLGLNNTATWPTAVVPEPALHTFSSERREQLGIPRGTRFYEESTYWNPSWTTAEGAIQTTNIYDMATTAVAVGEGTLLSPASHQAQVSPFPLGFGAPQAGCFNCATLTRDYNYGLGVVLTRSWILQNPLFAGWGAVEAYLPSRRIAVAVSTTFGEQSFDEQGNLKHGNASQNVFAEIGAYLAPEDAPPQPTGRVD